MYKPNYDCTEMEMELCEKRSTVSLPNAQMALLAKYDLTRTNCAFLDAHLTFPLLEFLCGKGIYNDIDLLECILETVSRTNMIDYTMDTRKRIRADDEMPPDLIQRKAAVIATLKRLQSDVKPIMKATAIMKSGEIMSDTQTFVTALRKDYNIQQEHINSAYTMAKYLYECGNYTEAASYLYFCYIVMKPGDANYENVLWGKLASEILTLNWGTAIEDLQRLTDYIETNITSPLRSLQQRAWVMHWAIVIFFSHAKGRDHLIDMFLYKPLYLNAIQTMCPHLLRYLTTAVVVTPSRRMALKDLIKVIEQEAYVYKDPITEFIQCLYVNFDFDGARHKLQQCEAVILNDFFIMGMVTDFVEQARLMVFETFCRIHQRVSIAMIADRLNMTPSGAELWIVNLIRNAGLNAKIDSQLGHVVMDLPPANPNLHLMERIDSLSERSEHLVGLIDRKFQSKNRSFEWWKKTN